MFQMLVKITSTFMLLLGLLNALSFGASAVAFSAEEVGVYAASASPSDSVQDLHAQDEHNDDCSDQHASCHQCHLGHCTFVISSSVRLIALFSSSRLEFENERMNGRDVTNVLRPPLA